MAFKVDFSRFKKVGVEGPHTILQHPDGHQIRIAHEALTSSHRKELGKLPMADGGQVSSSSSSPSSGSPAIDPKKAKEIQEGANQGGWPKDPWGTIKKGLNMEAEGGKIEKDPDPKPSPSPSSDDKSLGSIIGYPKAEGGEVEPLKPEPMDSKLDIEELSDKSAKPSTSKDKKPLITEPIKLADGGDVEAPAPDQQSMPVNVNNPQMPQNAQGQPQTPQAAQGQDTQAPQVQQTQNGPVLDFMGGYRQQVQGSQEQAAQQQMALQQEQVLHAQAQAAQKMMDQYQEHYHQLDMERNNFTQDVQNQHIDPQHYMGNMDTMGKIMTAVAIGLGGIGSGMTGQPNPALKYMNDQIDRDIDAQKAELGKRETLLSANLRQFGNLKDATDMTKLMQTDLVKLQLQRATANAQTPQAQQRAMSMGQQIQQYTDTNAQQLAQRRMLQANGGQQQQQGGLIQGDPAMYINTMVPKEHQEAVSKEVQRAQDTSKLSPKILKDYDDAVSSMQAAGGLGRAGALVHEPRSLSGLRLSIGTTVQDLEGSVRQAAMDNVKNEVQPKVTDTAEDMARRRQYLVDYLNAKSSSPRFKAATGIDLNRFQSTQPATERRALPNGDVYEFNPQRNSWIKVKQ